MSLNAFFEEQMSGDIVIELTDICKAFDGNPALINVSLVLKKRTVHCIVGENGAGKSTLIKILTGAYVPDSGIIVFDNKRYHRISPQLATQAGIMAVYQENILAESLSVAENIYAGRELPSKFGIVSFRRMRQYVEALMKKYDIELPISASVADLTAAQKQFVKILKSISMNPQILILDEPTAMLNIRDNQKILELVSIFRNEGACIVYISHQLSEVLAVADEITVLRDGCRISTKKNINISPQELTQDMVGRSMELYYRRRWPVAGENMPAKSEGPAKNEILFEVKNLQIEGFNAVNSFKVNRGEIVGITGMVGSGRTEILEGIFGYRKKKRGDFFLDGKQIVIKYPVDAINKSIGYITEDRQKTGLALSLSVGKNITCTALNIFRGLVISPRQEMAAAQKAADGTRVKCTSLQQPIHQLSGGNQQKVLLSRWTLKNPDLILLDEPTKGVDINAKYEIYTLLEELIAKGKSVLMVSSDMAEVISICDRVLIVHKGKICAELWGEDINEANIINHALGGE